MAKLQIFSNESFADRIDWLRRNIPGLAFAIVAISYLGAAVVIGMFVSDQLAPHFGNTAAYIMGFGLAIGAQAGRGTILFFGQGNPIRVHAHQYNWLIAVAMGVFTIWEVYHLVQSASLHISVFYTFASAIFVGVVIEVFLAWEVDRYTKIEISQDREAWTELKQYHLDQREFRDFLRDVKRSRPATAKKYQAPAKEGNGAMIH